VHDGEYVIVRVAQCQHGCTTLRLEGDLSITTLHNSKTFRDELATTGGDHANLPLGFSKSLMEWGNSLAWKVGQQDDIRGSSRKGDAICTRIGWYL